MCQAFKQEGYAPSLVVQWQPWSVFSDGKNLWEYYGINDSFPLFRIPRIRGLKLYHHHLISAFYAYLRHFDLVYARNLGAAAITARMGIPTIFEAHAPIANIKPYTRQFHKLLNAPGFRRLVVITSALKSHFMQCYPDHLHESCVVVAPDGVDLERFTNPPTPHQARKNLGLSPERFTVGYCGHLYPGRGIELILSLARRLPEMLFLIVGGNENDIRLQQANARQARLKNVALVGFVSNIDLPRYLFGCDVLLMPYQQKLEVSGGGGDTSSWMSPMKMFEYMATERLILSSNHPVLCEILRDNENAVLCDPTDVDAWKSVITRAIEDDVWRDRLAHQARQDVEQYTWRKRVQTVLAKVNVFRNQEDSEWITDGNCR